MKILITTILLTFLNISFATEQEDSAPNPSFCSSRNSCVQIQFEKEPKRLELGQFLLRVIPSESSNTINSLSVKLWMEMGVGHGHGSAPLKITPTNESNLFSVSNAWFVMIGTWQIIVNFKDNGIDQKIIIPVFIKE